MAFLLDGVRQLRRIELDNVTTTPHFIGSWFIEPLSICDDLIDYFESHPNKQRSGLTAAGANADAKKSTDVAVRATDVALPGNEALRQYFDALYACYGDYLEQWPYLKRLVPRIDIGTFNIQRYLPGEHFQIVHTERSSLSTLHRVFAWMTYLNDVDDGGSTSFTHFGLDVQPQAGKTLIWPSEWTHAHCGNVLNAGSKYIVTGWMHFPAEY